METNSKVAVTRWWLSLTLLLPRMKPAVTGSDDIDEDIVKAGKGIERDIEDLPGSMLRLNLYCETIIDC